MIAAVLIVAGSGALAAAQDGDDGYQSYNDTEYEQEHPTYRNNSSFERQGDTFVGDHVAFTLDEDRPGITGYQILDGNDTVFVSITLPGDEARWTVHEDRFMMDTQAAQLMVRDHESYRITADADGDDGDGPSTAVVPEVRLGVAEGVEVSENETWSGGDDRIYDVSAGEHDLKLGGENLTYAEGTFRARDDVMFGGDFPATQEPEPRHEEPDRYPPEDRRERESEWTRDGDSFEGEHVRFAKDEALPGVVDVTPTDPDVTVLSEVALPGDEPEWRAHGRMFAMRTSAAELRIVDIPPALFHLEVDGDEPATLDLADGVTAEEIPVEDGDAPENASMYRLHLPGNRTAWLGATDAHIVHADTTNGAEEWIEVGGIAHARLAPGEDPRHDPGHDGDADEEPGPDGRDERRGPPDDPGAAELDRESRQQVDQAAATGKVGVEVHPSGGNATAVSMGHVTVRETRGPSGDVKAGVTVEAPDDSEGTVVRFSLDAAALEGVDVTEVPDALTVRYDNETIAAADDLEDALDWSDDDGEPEYLLLVGAEEVEVLVSVPHFSPHTIEVVETASSGAESVDGAPGPGVLAALVSGLGAAVLRRR